MSLTSHLLTVRGLHKRLTYRVYILYNILEGWVRSKLREQFSSVEQGIYQVWIMMKCVCNTRIDDL